MKLVPKSLSERTSFFPFLSFSPEPHFWCSGIDNPDYALFPCKEFQYKWLRAYLKETAELKGEDPTAVKEADVEKMYIEVGKFVPVSIHIYCSCSLLI